MMSYMMITMIMKLVNDMAYDESMVMKSIMINS
jgi:hypothetical protein